MKRAALIVVAAVVATIALAGTATAWPPFCKEPVYSLTGKCI